MRRSPPFGRPMAVTVAPSAALPRCTASQRVAWRCNLAYGVWYCVATRCCGSGTDLQRVLSDAPLRLRVLPCKALVVCAALPKGLALFGRERQLLLDQRHALAETADSAHTDPAVGWA